MSNGRIKQNGHLNTLLEEDDDISVDNDVIKVPAIKTDSSSTSSSVYSLTSSIREETPSSIEESYQSPRSGQQTPEITEEISQIDHVTQIDDTKDYDIGLCTNVGVHGCYTHTHSHTNTHKYTYT